MGQAAPTGSEHPKGVGLINQQQSPVVLAEAGDDASSGTRPLHAEQAFCEHEYRPAILTALLLQQGLQRGAVVWGENAAPGAVARTPTKSEWWISRSASTRLLAISQGDHFRQIGLKSRWEQQNPLRPSQAASRSSRRRGRGRLAADSRLTLRPDALSIDGGVGRRRSRGWALRPVVVYWPGPAAGGKPGLVA